MPRASSFKTRRGKPRLDTQQSNAIVSNRFSRKLPHHQRSKLAQIKPNFSNKNTNNSNTTSTNNTEERELTEQEKWQSMDVSADNPLSAPLHTSSFATRYPEHRESYIRMSLKKMQTFLNKYGLKIEAIYHQCSLVVSTSNKTWDPYSIIKARDMIRLIARYVPFEHASKVLEDGVMSDIIEIGKTNVSRNQVRFIKRRSRLIGPNGVTLRAIELLTKCYVLVYGRTVCVIGDLRGIRLVRRIVMDCMNNIHPIYQLKRLMVEQELSANPELSKESWDRFLPTFKKIKRNNNGQLGTNKSRSNGLTVNQIKKIANKKKRTCGRYTPWPPAPVPSKIDIALENGAYWNKEWRAENLKRLTAEQKVKKEIMQHKNKQITKKQKVNKRYKTMRRIQKEARFIAPKERDSEVIKMKLKEGGRKGGRVFAGSKFKNNLTKIYKQGNKKNTNESVNKFLV